ncbi:c-type cytochrome [Xylophilus sp. GOD-11R]|uniref:cytochrome c oxidase subunit II n=1 Tax=Xylophilus sp. GOD-11R TaxID=3089814 RepID=UPI00298C88BF|nr:c-type cytochrome [Xylophilus sp. GOD-11R]WPB55848.1 c-type cytochrome [Xylophilus sp. GOD-11R]
MSLPNAGTLVLSPAGPAAAAIAEVSWVLMLCAAALFTGTMVLLGMALRRRAGRIRPMWWLAGGGLVLPAVVLTALFVYGMERAPPWGQAPPPGAMVVSITGRMWWWEIRYRDPATGADVVTANELRLPVGRPVYLGLSSREVIHSLWIPELGGKMDMVPGRTNHLLLQASRPGVFRGQCAEFCGEAHARMALHAVAQPQADFDAWLAAQAKPAMSPATERLQAGLQVFQAQKCAACHTVRGVAEGARLGPDLTHVGSRLHLAAGTLPNDAASMARWLAHVQAMKPGARMPAYERLPTTELDALAAWLGSLR